jgi:NAD+ synthase
MKLNGFSRELLRIDCQREVDKITSAIREQVLRRFKKKGLIVAVSGGVDSSVVAALATLACGREKVLGLQMPERHSSSDTPLLGRLIVEHLGIQAIQQDISGILEAAGCYQRQEEAIRLVLPDYGSDWKSKIVLPSVVEGDQYRIFSVVAQSPSGERFEARLGLEAYLSLVAATNFKQRVRKMLEYYHADRLNYAVAGTPNRLEYDQGFFVKLGDGSADVKPIAHLYKTQVYMLAEYLEVPEAIRKRPPTTDTYSMPQSQEEFYFSLPYDKMDLVLFGKNHGYKAQEIGPAVGLTAEQVERVVRDIEGKRRVAQYLHASPVLVEAIRSAPADMSNL